MSKTSAEHLRALVAEKQDRVRRSFDLLLDALAANDRSQVLSANADLNVALNALGAVVSRQDWPQWLSDLLSQTQNYQSNHSNGAATWKAHLLSLIQNREDVRKHEWFLEDRPSIYFDPDEIIDRARSEFGIVELFDRVVVILEEIAKAGEIDSVKACSDLERIINVLRRARSGTFTSQVVSWQFARRFIPNLFTSYAKGSKVLGPIISAFEKTADELDVGLESVKDKIGQEIMLAATQTFQSDALRLIEAADIRALPNLTN